MSYFISLYGIRGTALPQVILFPHARSSGAGARVTTTYTWSKGGRALGGAEFFFL